MKVGFNARLLADPHLRGWNRYTLNLLAELPALGVRPLLYSDKPLFEEHLARLPADSFDMRIGETRPYLAWEQAWLPRQCARDRVEVLHAPANFGLPCVCPCPRVLTLHDAIDFAYTYPRMRLRDRWRPLALRGRLLQRVARTAAERVITVSQHARADLVSLLGIDSDRIRVIPEAADYRMFAGHRDLNKVLARHEIRAPYVFYVGGWERRKNVPFLVAAFVKADLEGVTLVLAGGRDSERSALVESFDPHVLSRRARLIGWVDDADLAPLYRGALAFVYPSEYEGFGLQICEAMAAGCPVLAARATSLPEVLGEGGATFGLESTEELAGLLRRFASDTAFHADMTRRAVSRARDFSWGRTAEATVAVYREITGLP